MPSGFRGYVRTVEHAPLRALPSRASLPADPRLARTYVGARLPQLDPVAVDALALVELSQVERGQAARELGLSDEQMGATLARGRKALRRSRHALAGSGWCERAERMVSDRLDDELASPARERLAAHLRNCPRCVEHELRLTQALDALIEGMPAPAKPAAAVRLVLPTVRALPPGSAPEELAEAPEEPALPPAPEEAALEAPPEGAGARGAARGRRARPGAEEPALEAPPEEPRSGRPRSPRSSPARRAALDPAPAKPALRPAPPPRPDPARRPPLVAVPPASTRPPAPAAPTPPTAQRSPPARPAAAAERSRPGRRRPPGSRATRGRCRR